MKKKLMLTGLGNEIDLATGKTVFTAIFNGTIRVPITEEGAKQLTQAIYGEPEEQVGQTLEPSQEESGSVQVLETAETNGVHLEDVPDSVYDDLVGDDGIGSI